MTTRSELAVRVRAFMDASLEGTWPEEPTALANLLWAWQVAGSPLLAALATAEREAGHHGVPCVPVDVFKRLVVGVPPPAGEGVTFRTSGTTGSGRGVHRMWDTSVYDHGSLAWARRCVPDMPEHVVALLDDPARAPDSSLSHMVSLFAPRTQIAWLVDDGVLDHDALRRCLASAREPLFVAATAFALAEAVQHRLPALPAGSLVMVTGGFKGRTTDLDHDALYARVGAMLRPKRIVTEYGMTELSSQLWGEPGEPYRAPPWVRVGAFDPATGHPTPQGRPGQLRFHDLANLDSCVGVETLDVGLVHADGGVELHGRLTGAEARGCSLTVEEAWARRTS